MRKNKFIAVGVATVLGIMSLTGCGSKESASQTTSYEGLTIRIQDNSDEGSFGIPEALGFWEDEFGADGITVEGIDIKGGSAFLDAIATDTIDIGVLGDQPVITGYVSGKNIKIIASSSEDTKSYRIVVKNGSDITDPSQLKGKKIAAQAGTNREKVLRQILEALDLTDNDVEIVNLSAADGIIALDGGDVDAVVLYADLISTDAGTTLTDYTPYGISSRVIAVNTVFAEKYPELTARILKVYQREADWLNENRDEAIKLIAELGEYTEDEATEIYERENRRIQITADDRAVYDSTAEFLYENGTIDNPVTSEELVDTTYLELAGLTAE